MSMAVTSDATEEEEDNGDDDDDDRMFGERQPSYVALPTFAVDQLLISSHLALKSQLARYGQVIIIIIMRRETIFVPQKQNDHTDDDDDEQSEVEDITTKLDFSTANPSNLDEEHNSEMQKPRVKYTGQSSAFMYAKMILPHVGLVLLLIVYLLIGATVFHHMEWENEKKAYFGRLIVVIYQGYRSQFISEKHLQNRSNNETIMWTFANSVFFSTTVLTTIGYGNIVPMTFKGRTFCIVFALFGIPLLLVTIADIGKFLSDLLTFLFQSYRAFKRKIRKQSRVISQHVREHSLSRSSSAGSFILNDIDDDIESNGGDELRIPVVMVLLVFVAYTALGGLLFRSLEGWAYFDAFYFCFVTMATIGFGDFVPTEQVFMFFTMAYIIFGLALATMCIDLTGTEYIRRIHYLGSKMGVAKGAVMTGIAVGEHLLKHAGIVVIQTASGKFVQVRGAELNSKTVLKMDGADFMLTDLQFERNILYKPLSASVQRVVNKHGIKIMPDEISDADGYIVQNKTYNRPPRRFALLATSPNAIQRVLVPSHDETTTMVVPFVLKESYI